MKRKCPWNENELMLFMHGQVRDLFPKGWDVRVDFGTSFGADGILTVVPPGGHDVPIAVEVKYDLEPRMVAELLRRHQARTALPLIVTAPYLSPETQDRLQQAGISYADLSGNRRLVLSNPPVFLRTDGAMKSPHPEKRPLHSLRGAGAAAVVRALCDLPPPYTMSELAKLAKLPIATVFRVVDLLERDDLLNREEGGRIVRTDWSGIIQRWAREYHVLKVNYHRSFFAPRGIQSVLEGLRGFDGPYSVTGSLAATQVAPIAAPRLAMIYADDLARMAEAIGIKPVETNPNVILIEPKARVALERTWVADDVTYAAHSQVAADLLNGPGRSPQEADALLAWMKDHEAAWRR